MERALGLGAWIYSSFSEQHVCLTHEHVQALMPLKFLTDRKGPRQKVCCSLFYFSACAVECVHAPMCVATYVCACMLSAGQRVMSDVFLNSSLLYALDPELRDLAGLVILPLRSCLYLQVGLTHLPAFTWWVLGI